jgi:RHS repeat-associated protein
MLVTSGYESSNVSNVVDSNGNQITFTSGTTSTYTDTLGTTALTIAGSGTPSSPTTYSYTAPSGATAKYTEKYTNKTVKTNFGCSGFSEFGPTAENLVTEIDLPDQSVNPTDKYTISYEPTPGYSGDVTGRIASITLPTGGTIAYTYTGGSSGHITCADGSAATILRYTPDSGSSYWTYAHSETGSTWTTSVTDPLGNETDLNFQAVSQNGSTSLPSWEGYETQRKVYQGLSGSGTILQTINTCYNGAASPCNTTAITLPITRRTAYVQWPGSTILESETDRQYNPYGQPTEVDQYAYGSGAPGGVVRKVVTSYAYMSNSYGFINKPAQVTVEDASNNIKSQTTYCYDEATPSGTMTCNAVGSPTATSNTPQHVSITGSRGNVTTVASLVSGSTTLAKTFSYFDTGNVNVATDVNGAATTYTYGACGNSFPTVVNEPLGLSKSMTWNCTGGLQTSITDENGNSASTTFSDPYLWRPYAVYDPASNVAYLTYTGQTVVESSMTFNAGSSVSDMRKTVDGLGRIHLLQVKQGPSATTYDSIEVDYDGMGRVDRSTLPYSGTAGQTNSSGASVNASYDALGRKASSTDSGGLSITFGFVQNDVLKAIGPAPSGENTKRRQFEYDALGRLTSVCEITSATGSGTCSQSSPATGYWTRYSYDLNNLLTGVTQNAQSSNQQTRVYAYDGLGRMTLETNPESGTTTYTYDTDATCGNSKGDLVKKVDAVGDTICYTYDSLHRTKSIAYTGTYSSVTPNRYFSFDTATVNSLTMVGARGHVAEAYTCFAPCTTKLTDVGFSYTARGETSDVYESTPHSGGYYHVSQAYWANGALSRISGVAALPTVTYNVDSEGRIYSAAASSGPNPLSSTVYNVAGLPTAVTFGSSDSDSFQYDPNTDRMTQYKFNVNGQSVIGNLTWNSIGTLAGLGITDPFNSADAQTCSFSHDDLSRIASANCGSTWSQAFTFDAFGNINKSGSMSFGATYSSVTNQMTSIGSSTPSYDLNGQVTNDFLHTYAWDANGHAVTIDGVGVGYDALGRMVEQNRSGVYSEIVYSPSGAKLAIMNGSALQKGFVSLTGGSTAVYGASGLDHYRHSDWLGSARLGSSSSRTVLYDVGYGPYGETYAQSGTPDMSFTGINQDTDTNLYDFPEREYGTQGRWPSPDPAGTAAADASDPQTWDRYAYVRNSPLSMTDPTGLDGFDYYLMSGGVYGPAPDNPFGINNVSCTIDGAPGSCMAAFDLLSYGAAARCPGDVCQAGVRAGNDGNWYYVVKYPAGTWVTLTYNTTIDGQPAIEQDSYKLKQDWYTTYKMAQCDSSEDTCAMDATLGLAGRWSNAGATAALIVTAPETLLAAGIVAPAAAGDFVAASGNIGATATESASEGLASIDAYVPGGVKGVTDFTSGFVRKYNPPLTLPGLLGAGARDIFDMLTK